MDILASLTSAIGGFGAAGYAVVALVSFAESLAIVGEFVPGTVFLMFAGFLAANGYFDIGDLIWFAAIGSALGDNISYAIGIGGKNLFHNNNKILKISHLEKGERFFRKHGKKSVLLGKLIGPMRPIVPFVAGLFKMDRTLFVSLSIAGGFLWASIYLFLGYFFGGAIDIMEMWSKRAGFSIFIAGITTAFLWFLVKKSSIMQNSNVREFINRHPSLSAFINRRFNKEKFSGLPLTLLLAAFALIFFMFVVIANNVAASGALASFDFRAADFFFARRSSGLIAVFTFVTLFGNWQIVAAGAVTASLVLWLLRERAYIIPLWLAIAGSGAFDFASKLVFHRQRPEVSYYIEHSFSFPSGHATIAAALYGFLAYVFFMEIKKRTRMVPAVSCALAVVFAIGLSRLYLGAHFVSDVLAGYLLGLFALVGGIAITELAKGTLFAAVPPTKISPKIKFVSAAIIAAYMLFYAVFAFNYNPPVNTHAAGSRPVAGVTSSRM